jgi:EAL domain-containing protein (putative c-di-GMP-specific phosphodiesterase class I)
VLRAHGVAGGDLRLEVTESAVMADPARAGEVLARLAALGLGISVDDYGTGYSSLAYLKRLPLDELKIDRAFVRDLRGDKADGAIVASTVGLGHTLGLRVVAEGVEDQATQEALAALGCDALQGYHLSRPLPAADLDTWLSARVARSRTRPEDEAARRPARGAARA